MRGSGSAKRDPLLRAPDFDSLPGPPDPADKGHKGRGGRMLPVAVRKSEEMRHHLQHPSPAKPTCPIKSVQYRYTDRREGHSRLTPPWVHEFRVPGVFWCLGGSWTTGAPGLTKQEALQKVRPRPGSENDRPKAPTRSSLTRLTNQVLPRCLNSLLLRRPQTSVPQPLPSCLLFLGSTHLDHLRLSLKSRVCEEPARTACCNAVRPCQVRGF